MYLPNSQAPVTAAQALKPPSGNGAPGIIGGPGSCFSSSIVVTLVVSGWGVRVGVEECGSEFAGCESCSASLVDISTRLLRMVVEDSMYDSFIHTCPSRNEASKSIDDLPSAPRLKQLSNPEHKDSKTPFRYKLGIVGRLFRDIRDRETGQLYIYLHTLLIYFAGLDMRALPEGSFLGLGDPPAREAMR